ncbi:MAG: hypothetical protein JWM65_2596 [Sphingomonas bacterium]|nr:hypothetical protein [Sphingomonas bacterium]
MSDSKASVMGLLALAGITLMGGCTKFTPPSADVAVDECLRQQRQGVRKMSFERAGEVVAACEVPFSTYAWDLVRREDRFRKNPQDPRMAGDYQDIKAVLEQMARCDMSVPLGATCYHPL